MRISEIMKYTRFRSFQFNKEKLGKYLIKYDFWKNLILQQFNGKNKLVQSCIYKIHFLVGCLLYYIHFVEIFYLNYESRLFVRNANCENIQNVIFEPLCIISLLINPAYQGRNVYNSTLAP